MSTKRILSIVETAYRGTLEEQDDAALWFMHAIRNAGSPVSIVLRGNAVNYAVRGQDAAGVSIGSVVITRPPRLDADLIGMKEKGISVFVVREDAEARGIPRERMRPELEMISVRRLPELMASHDQVWHW